MTQFQKTTLKDNAVAMEIYNIIKYCVIRISLFVSVFNLSALTIDRLFAIKFPFIHRKQGKQFALKVRKICCIILQTQSNVLIISFFKEIDLKNTEKIQYSFITKILSTFNQKSTRGKLRIFLTKTTGS